MTQTPTQDDDGVLAAEYVVGLLSKDERQAVETRARTDQTFAAEIMAWEAYFAGLNADYGTLQPSDKIKKAIDKRLFGAAFARSRRWGWAAGLVAAFLTVAVILNWLTIETGDAPHMIAQLESGESAYRFAVDIGAAGTEIEIALTAGDLVANRVFELWLLPDGEAPRSLGTFEQAGRLTSDTVSQLRDGSVLAVSLEPVGGSPTGAPTGPVLAVGVLNDA